MNASESEEEEEKQLLGHYFIYVFINNILFKQREHVANGRGSPSSGVIR